MKRHYLYGLLGLLSLLGFVGVFTQERAFLAFFAFAVDFTHFFQRKDEMAVAYLNRSAALGFHWGMAATGVVAAGASSSRARRAVKPWSPVWLQALLWPWWSTLWRSSISSPESGGG